MLQGIINGFDGDPNFGMMLVRMRDGKTLFEHHPDRYFTPASVTKLFTAYAALMHLGKDYRYETSILSDDNRNIYVHFTGDPTLTQSDLDGLVASIKAQGVTHIEGHLVVDDTAFDDHYFVNDSAYEDRKFCYGTAISSIMVDGNCFYSQLVPGSKSGQPAVIKSEHRMLLERLDNQAISRFTPKGACPLELTETGKNAYRISGCIGPKTPPLPLRISVQDPRMMIKKLLPMLLKKHHIHWHGEVQFSATPSSARRLSVHKSEPLEVLLREMGHKSNNLVANSLFKHLPYRLYATKGTFKEGSDVMKGTLQQFAQIDARALHLEDGAGMSLRNVVTPRIMTDLLTVVYQNNDVRDIFIKSLPRGGMEGTLQHRMKSSGVKGLVQAKTGGADSISALSGYLTHPQEGVLAFAMLNNGFLDKKKQKKLEDSLLTYLITGRKHHAK